MRTPLLPERWVSFEYSSFDQFPNLRGRRKKKEKMARGRGDYSREAIILNISVKGERLFEGGD